jgi:Spy/CpxP family protein refolding chaperone
MSNKSSLLQLAIAFCASLFLSSTAPMAAFAPTDRPICDWTKLSLNEDQSKQIHEIEEGWNQKYREMMPSLVEDQQRLSKLLEDHNSDPVEIMTVQTSVARKREQLNAVALATYLKKKSILDENQKHLLELMTKRAIAERHRNDATSSVNEEMPDHIQGLMQRVRNIWPVQGER